MYYPDPPDPLSSLSVDPLKLNTVGKIALLGTTNLMVHIHQKALVVILGF
ncbi:hypothetical protein Lalb_Chr05g0226791 [Lupinus albus]|uniref:Uncharacterized protein n=1 Tax=Lupinus albus TaxID=3870 RepID=A0A6A4QLA7_LUPAL|nr:hypothetical protein Lalb_Chr05g0226791 [Lupinus albus]